MSAILPPTREAPAKYTTQNTTYDDGLDIWCAIIIVFSFHTWHILLFAHPYECCHYLRQSVHYAGEYVSWSPVDLLCWVLDSIRLRTRDII